jgi:glucose/arabinose dehydrogenase
VVRTQADQDRRDLDRRGAAGFLTNIGRPLDVAVGPDSALYVADFGTGTIWRVFHTSTEVGVPDEEGLEAAAPRP